MQRLRLGVAAAELQLGGVERKFHGDGWVKVTEGLKKICFSFLIENISPIHTHIYIYIYTYTYIYINSYIYMIYVVFSQDPHICSWCSCMVSHPPSIRLGSMDGIPQRRPWWHQDQHSQPRTAIMFRIPIATYMDKETLWKPSITPSTECLLAMVDLRQPRTRIILYQTPVDSNHHNFENNNSK
jgi:hypothetical protein